MIPLIVIIIVVTLLLFVFIYVLTGKKEDFVTKGVLPYMNGARSRRRWLNHHRFVPAGYYGIWDVPEVPWIRGYTLSHVEGNYGFFYDANGEWWRCLLPCGSKSTLEKIGFESGP